MNPSKSVSLLEKRSSQSFAHLNAPTVPSRQPRMFGGSLWEWKNADDIPTIEEVRSALQLLTHPSIGVVEQDEDGYRVTTDYENGVQLVQSLGDIVRSSATDASSG